ncbi:atrial natriuretic peptide-converting enzyme-like isoform X1 [Neodiprion virginianus]|uniref:atrial natriuretic peptide-converting enzyme-like isoform X1 n=1 Tax=Neodiprion virginianus TaxID=2961670 RepID=UPI001EE7154F|nr:atrial natriuretic peptide-converting enzyme-like isoform X1 [Neodiprion virginianus]XP_046620351.1 atrial natriuretic peptide-converting enzyme-like isoform X1 [Neodiprion virginianus]XP_046620352.1 atrial natriuretic peptide-converting enzyme-like isoform X1 [Neodiprion virginianus]
MSGTAPPGGDTSPTRQPRQSRTHSVGFPTRTSLLPEPPPAGNVGAPPIPRRHSATPAVAPPPIPLRAPAIPKRCKNERPIPLQVQLPAVPRRSNPDRKPAAQFGQPKADPTPPKPEPRPTAAKSSGAVSPWQQRQEERNLIELDKASRDLDKRLQERTGELGKHAGVERLKFEELQRAARDLERRLHEKPLPVPAEPPEVPERAKFEDQLKSRYDSDMEKARNMLQNSFGKREKTTGEKLEKLPKATQTNIPPPLSAIVQSPVPKPISVRQDSNVSSDSFSQTSSPSYTSKTMEAPLLPHKHANGKVPGRALVPEPENPPGSPITKSMSTPASLQTIVRFHNGSNMSLHHRIIRDIRRPSSHYVTTGRLRFRFAQVLVNAVALFAIAGGLAAYFKSYPAYTVRLENNTVHSTEMVIAPGPPKFEPPLKNPAPGICLPVIVSFCQYHKIPYNFTVFPNYMGNFGQRDAQHELELYDAVVDVRCYELAALFLCSVFVPKCGVRGQVVRPCRSLCYQTKHRCGFFLEVFGLTLPEYLECNLFPENADPEVCVGHREVIEAAKRAEKPVCTSGFQCDGTRCIPVDWRCDGHVDCADQSDEIGCGECGATAPSTSDEESLADPVLHCGERQCMSSLHVCDGTTDCPWGQDERNCLRLSERNGDIGKGRLEIYHAENGNFSPACVMNWDAETSPHQICSYLGYKVANSSVLSRNGTNVSMPQRKIETSVQWRLAQKTNTNILKELRRCTKYENYPTVELACSEYGCGKRKRIYGNSRPQARIVGGVEAAPGDWPFLAALLGGPEQVFYCAGVLISDQWVLTASHCVGKKKSGSFSHSDVSGWTIQLGITRRHAHTYLGQKVKVKRVVPHPNYNLGVAHDNDVALFQLDSRVQFHDHLRPVCLPTADMELTPGTLCTVIGWGKKEDTDVSEYEPAVNEVNVPVLNRELCNLWLEHKELNVTDGMICAGYPEGGKDACQGDSGGPLLCRDKKDPERWFVGGIVSWGIKCAHPKLPGVYAYVPRYTYTRVLRLREDMITLNENGSRNREENMINRGSKLYARIWRRDEEKK